MPETIFHKIINREIPADIVYEDELAIAFKDVNPVAPTHILIVPKKTIPKLSEATKEDRDVLGHLMYLTRKIADEMKISDYRVAINSGEAVGQTVFQLHLHLLAGREFNWPPG